MYYAPHLLYRKDEKKVRDELNRIISVDDSWELIGECRCDDNTTQKFEDKNGRVFIPKYKIVSERYNINEGDYVQCLVKGTGEVRGQGRVLNSPKCNYLNYMVMYV